MNSELRLVEESEPTATIQFDRLQKGDVIRVHEIESARGVTRGTDAFRLAMLALRAEVTDHFANREPPVVITLREDAECGLLILTDEEALAANSRAKQLGVRRFRRAHDRHIGIDRANIPEGKRNELDRVLELGSRVIQAIRRELRREPPKPKPRVRQTPLRSK